MDFKAIEKKWQSSWEENGILKVEVDERPKYYIAIVYPYTNGLLHLGHLYTYMVSDIRARFKRMQGHNVLVKFAFHCTGTPIVSAANRVKQGDEKQINILKQMGIPHSEIPNFTNPQYWTTYFPREVLKDIKSLGFAIDERYTFKTTPLNPPYDKFIQWQFNKLKEKEYVKKGKHPVVWCPAESTPVGDHDRSEGEGETPQEFLLFKHQLADGRFVITATLRQDTVLGITNLFVNPQMEYIQANVDGEEWILGRASFDVLPNQGHKVKLTSTIKGSELIGLRTKEFDGSRVLILPAYFLDEKKGTGIVHSVPSDSADDYIALRNLQKDSQEIEKWGLDKEEVKSIEPIPVLDTPEYGDIPAKKIIEKYGVESQKEKDKLEKIRKELYKISHYTATFNKKYENTFSLNLAGQKVDQGKELIRSELIEKGFATPYYELTGPVITRSGNPCVVKLVENQWFLEYNDPEWKKLAHRCLDGMDLYPETIRKQFHYVIDWLRNWACTREFGLGTKLPWDDNWVIESLSDSTIQMAYATISKYLQHSEEYGFSVDQLSDELFDYVFLGRKDAKEVSELTGIKQEMVEKMRTDFMYWYPFDFRNSAKDLIQNHLTFSIFNHVAIFPERHWPQSFCVNGRILINNEKMAKSKGNFKTMREEYEANGADIVRLTAANSGEGIDDANYDTAFLNSIKKKLEDLSQFYDKWWGVGREDSLQIDDWFNSAIHEAIKKTTQSIEGTLNKSAVQSAFLDLNRNVQWYLRRTKQVPNKELMNFFIETQIKLLTPFIPHFCEEVWHNIGKESFVTNESWPVFDDNKILDDANKKEQLITRLLDDVRQVQKIAKITPKKITIITAPGWKVSLFKKVVSIIDKDQKEIISEVMKEYSQYGQEVMKFLPKLLTSRKLPDVILDDELALFKEATPFLEEELSAEIEVIPAEESLEQKAKQVLPSKPAIILS